MSDPPTTRGAGDDNLAAALALAEQIRPALERRERAKLNDIIRQLIAMQAPMGEQWQQIAYLAANNGELTLARRAADLLEQALGSGPSAQYRKASVLSLLGAWEEAEALLRALPDREPDPVATTYSRGIVALNLGRVEEARGHLEQVTQARPQTGSAWLALSMSTNFAQEPALADRMIAAARAMERAPPAERVPYCYALGKTYADRGDHAQAFDAFARGAREMKSFAVYDRQQDAAEAAEAVEGYHFERIAAIAARQREPTARTIFVVGLPRSGTTLIEQILTSHSAVSGGAEINRLPLLADEVGGRSCTALASYADAYGVASLPPLWDHWLDELFPAAGRVVDKTVSTSRYLGLAAAVLPQAPLIWVTREPLDRAWSCFRTNFNGTAMPWSYDLEDIAFHFRLEDQLLERWRQILGDRLLVVPYESLVDQPAPQIRRILAHCQLSEETQVFAPHENRRAVATASAAQVRQPINRNAVGSAEPYREFLRPFLEAYYG